MRSHFYEETDEEAEYEWYRPEEVSKELASEERLRDLGYSDDEAQVVQENMGLFLKATEEHVEKGGLLMRKK